MAEKKYGMSTCMFGDKFIYAIGGWNGSLNGTTERYDITGDSWTSVQITQGQLAKGDSVFACQISSRCLLIAGGNNGGFWGQSDV